MTETRETLIAALAPLAEAVAKIDFADPASTRRLEAVFPHGGMGALKERLVKAHESGLLAERGDWPVKWGRLAKPTPATFDLSIDAVVMTGPGPGHRHPNGECSIAFALEGSPTFDGRREGWVLEGPGSWHIPTVEGGKMLIIYFLPAGAIDFAATGPA